MTERPDMADKIPLAASFSHSQRIVPSESSPANRPQRIVPSESSPTTCPSPQPAEMPYRILDRFGPVEFRTAQRPRASHADRPDEGVKG
jgi:hypothetical protein